MNRYGGIEPEQIAKLWNGVELSQYHAAYTAFRLIKQDNAGIPASDVYWWGITAAAAYRAGRLSMWRECAKRRGRPPAASYRRALHQLAGQIKDESRLKRLYDLAQYLWLEEY